tara:strand:+ start:541 stop:759 length:219 start_codon:yes stop_codon:yes gene_type:complete
MSFMVKNGGEMKAAENTSAARQIATTLADKSGEKSYIYRLPTVIEEVIYPKKKQPAPEPVKEPVKPKSKKGK